MIKESCGAMLEQWVIDKLNPLKDERLVILADPQRMIRAGAQVVDGWAKDNGFTVLFCSGNLALREMYENLRGDSSAKIILVDRTREKAKLPLFYPDIEARCKPKARLTITLRDFLINETGDERWPLLRAGLSARGLWRAQAVGRTALGFAGRWPGIGNRSASPAGRSGD